MITGVRIRATKDQIDRFNKLRDFRDKVARDLQLDPSILAPKAALEAAAANAHAAVLLPWQRQLLHLPELPEVVEVVAESTMP